MMFLLFLLYILQKAVIIATSNLYKSKKKKIKLEKYKNFCYIYSALLVSQNMKINILIAQKFVKNIVSCFIRKLEYNNCEYRTCDITHSSFSFKSEKFHKLGIGAKENIGIIERAESEKN